VAEPTAAPVELDEDPLPDVSLDVLFPHLAQRPLARPAASPSRSSRETSIRAHIARRMRGASQRDHARLASIVVDAAEWSRLEPALILAMIEVESNFDPTARSNRDARGLMQLRPATLWEEAARSGLAGDDPHAPDLNVRAGALYYRRLLDAFGEKDLALMAYNAGPNRILGLLRTQGIPERFREYPRRVRTAEERFRRALAMEPGRAPASAEVVAVN
jgi:soluble lytic murein transglycosylase-like protein